MIRRAICTGTARMHRCTRGCVVLFRGTTGVGTHGLPTRSRVSDLTRRVIDAAISRRRGGLYAAAASRAPEMAGFVVSDDATVRTYPTCPAETNAFGTKFVSKEKKRKKKKKKG